MNSVPAEGGTGRQTTEDTRARAAAGYAPPPSPPPPAGLTPPPPLAHWAPNPSLARTIPQLVRELSRIEAARRHAGYVPPPPGATDPRPQPCPQPLLRRGTPAAPAAAALSAALSAAAPSPSPSECPSAMDRFFAQRGAAAGGAPKAGGAPNDGGAPCPASLDPSAAPSAPQASGRGRLTALSPTEARKRAGELRAEVRARVLGQLDEALKLAQWMRTVQAREVGAATMGAGDMGGNGDGFLEGGGRKRRRLEGSDVAINSLVLQKASHVVHELSLVLGAVGSGDVMTVSSPVGGESNDFLKLPQANATGDLSCGRKFAILKTVFSHMYSSQGLQNLRERFLQLDNGENDLMFPVPGSDTAPNDADCADAEATKSPVPPAELETGAFATNNAAEDESDVIVIDESDVIVIDDDDNNGAKMESSSFARVGQDGESNRAVVMGNDIPGAATATVATGNTGKRTPIDSASVGVSLPATLPPMAVAALRHPSPTTTVLAPLTVAGAGSAPFAPSSGTPSAATLFGTTPAMASAAAALSGSMQAHQRRQLGCDMDLPPPTTDVGESLSSPVPPAPGGASGAPGGMGSSVSSPWSGPSIWY